MAARACDLPLGVTLCLWILLQVQTIGFLSYLYNMGMKGPFMILGPLSTLPNWVSEFERWAPSIPCVMYHGNKQERADIRNKRMKLGISQKTWHILTIYGPPMNFSCSSRPWSYMHNARLQN